VESWTPTWPPTGYTISLYNGVPGTSPTAKTQTISFTAPAVAGTYYLWLCYDAQYSMQNAINYRTTSMNGLAGHVKVTVSGSTPAPTPSPSSSSLLTIPAAPYGWQYTDSSHNSLMTNPYGGYLTSVSKQTVSATPGQAVSIDLTYNVYVQSSPNNPSEIDQLFLVESWTPSWPPTGYTIPVYNGMPGRSPGVTQTTTISFTTPVASGTYYLWLCYEAQYNMADAVNQRTRSMSGLPAHIKIIVASSTTTPTPTPSSTNPVGYWKFDDGAGTTATDSSGNGNNGVIHSASWTTGKSGGALRFNGVDSYVKIPHNSVLSGFSQLTMEVWVKMNSFRERPIGIVCKASGTAMPTSDAEYALVLFDKTPSFEVYNGNYLFQTTGDQETSQTDTWYHIAGTWSGTSYAFYVNGVLVDSGSNAASSPHSYPIDLEVGRIGTYSWTYFDGVIDEVKIYNYARTPQQITDDYNSVTPTVTPTPTPAPTPTPTPTPTSSLMFDPVQDTFYFHNFGYGVFPDQQMNIAENPLSILDVAYLIYTDPVYNSLNAAVPGASTLMIPWVYYYLSDNNMFEKTLTGHCYGISKLEVDWYNNPLQRLNYPATVQSLSMDTQLHQKIDYAQQTQILDFYTFSRMVLMSFDGFAWSNLQEYQTIKNIVNSGVPTILGIYDKSNVFSSDPEPFVHAVVVYKIESAGSIDTVYIADPNKIIHTLEFDTSKENLDLTYRVAALGITDQTVFSEFGQYVAKMLAFWVQCPVQMQITNATGQSVGWTANGVGEQNFNALLYQVNDTQLVIIPDPSGTYGVQLVGTGSGNYNLTTFKPSQGSIFAESTTANVTLNQQIEYTVSVANGASEGSFSSIGNPYFIGLIVVAVVVVASALLLFRKRNAKRKKTENPLPAPQPNWVP
jgi:hypothetical protein